jgi:hypothetical protein
MSRAYWAAQWAAQFELEDPVPPDKTTQDKALALEEEYERLNSSKKAIRRRCKSKKPLVRRNNTAGGGPRRRAKESYRSSLVSDDGICRGGMCRP